MSGMSLTKAVLAAWASIVLPGLVRAELVVEPVFGPADPGGPYKHPAAIEQLTNRRLFISSSTAAEEVSKATRRSTARGWPRGRPSGRRRRRSPIRQGVRTGTASFGRSRAGLCGCSMSCVTATRGLTP